MRQHVNPLSKVFQEIEPIPALEQIFNEPTKPLHLDVGCGSGTFLLNLANQNKNWNYIGLEIREKLVHNAKFKLKNESIDNLFFAFGNANYLIQDCLGKFPTDILFSVSFNFPDPWFKKKHHKRRIVQPQLIHTISQLMVNGGYISIKSDIEELFIYMDMTIMNSKSFINYVYQDNEMFDSHNPINLKTNRENYVIKKKLKVFERLYKKIIF
tara:strand:- start:358 stop:993 length:636 start_codon:yes stop_codon:yes gene_type:complete